MRPKVHNPVNKNQWIKNLSDTDIPPDVVDVVSLGPSFSNVSNITRDDVFTIVKNMKNCLQFLDVNNTVKNDIREKITDNINGTLKKVNYISKEERSFTKKLSITKSFLKNNPNIFLPKPTKAT